MTLSGDLGFSKIDSDIVAVGNDVPSLAAGPVFVRLNEADFGLVVGEGSTAFELKNGSFEAGIEGLAGISADEVIVQYTSATTAVAADTTINVLDLEYTFENAIAVDTVAFMVIGFEANVADFVSLSGDLGFKKEGADIIAVGNDVSASLDAGTAFVRLENADFGLVTGNGNLASNSPSSFAAGIDGLAGISAEEVTIQYTNATTSVDAATRSALLI